MRRFACFLVAFALAVSPVLAAAEPKGDAKAGEKKEEEGLLKLKFDTGFWTAVVFLLLLLILKKAAWEPISEGLHKREATIQASLDEAKALRESSAKAEADFKTKLDAAYAEIPKLLDEARRDAVALKEQMRSEAAADIQKERQRLLREVDVAQDQALQEIWNQAAQIATLISTKAIGRGLSLDDHRRLIDETMTELRDKASN